MRVVIFWTMLLLGTVVLGTTSEAQQSRLSIQLGATWLPSSNDLAARALSPMFGYHVNLDSAYVLSIRTGAAFLLSLDRPNTERTTVISPTNVIVGIVRPFDVSGQAVYGGVFVGAPLALYMADDIEHKRLVDFAHTVTASAHGWADPYPWMVNTIPVGVVAEATVPVQSLCSLHAAVRPAALLSLSSRASGFAVSTTIDVQCNIERIRCGVGLNWFGTTQNVENNDNDQASIHVVVGWDGPHFRTNLRGNVNLDAPFGINAEGPKPTAGVVASMEFVL
ncbi:MAG: hypothetical protein MUC47_02575 [Candidatus Kapabacteria bacterium]|nr:hypothetical protein [Candidatus Kapabacteria bacterium]